MNERIPHGTLETLLLLASMGALIGIGKLLDASEPVSWRKAIGRAIVTSGLALSGGLVLVMFPQAPILVVLAAGAAAASLGTSYLENLLSRYSKQ